MSARTLLLCPLLEALGWNRDPYYPSPSEREVLRVLREAGGELYGLDIVKRAEGPRVGRGTVYPILDKLEQVGLVTSRAVEPTRLGMLSRRVYRLTEAP